MIAPVERRVGDELVSLLEWWEGLDVGRALVELRHQRDAPIFLKVILEDRDERRELRRRVGLELLLGLGDAETRNMPAHHRRMHVEATRAEIETL